MKLYGSTASPFVRKVRIAIGELGLDKKVEFVASEGTPFDEPGDRAKAPLRKVPFLELDEGRVVYDSRVIIEALTQNLPNQTLVPASALRRLDTLTREALGDGLCDAALSASYERRLRPAEKVWDAWIEAQMGKVMSALDTFEADKGYDGRFDIGDCALAAALVYLDLRFEDYPWRPGRARLTAWWDSVKTRPSVAATL